MNFPAGHQQSLMPAMSRSSPEFEPLKAEASDVRLESPTDIADSTPPQPRRPHASRTNEQMRLTKDMTVSLLPNATPLSDRRGERATLGPGVKYTAAACPAMPHRVRDSVGRGNV